MATMQTNSSATVSGLSYQQAVKAARKAPGRVFVIDSGEGWKSEISYCPRRGRLLQVAISPAGMRIV